MTSNDTPYWIRSFTSTVPGVTVSPPVTPSPSRWRQIREYLAALWR